MENKENSYKLKQEVFLDQCCLHLAKWSIYIYTFMLDAIILINRFDSTNIYNIALINFKNIIKKTELIKNTTK